MAKAKPTWNKYQNSGFYNASGVGALQGQLGNYSLDRTALGQQAANALQSGYNANVLAANQQLAQQTTGYNNQLLSVQQAFDMQRRAANSQFDQSGSTALNQIGKRGMGRSSIVGTTLGSIESARGMALNDIGTNESNTRTGIANNIALANDQNAQTLKMLSGNLASDTLARTDEMYNSNLQGQTALQAQIAQLQQQGYQNYISQWNRNHPKGSGSRRRSASRSNPGPTTPPPPGSNPFTPSTETNNFGKERY